MTNKQRIKCLFGFHKPTEESLHEFYQSDLHFMYEMANCMGIYGENYEPPFIVVCQHCGKEFEYQVKK